LPIDNDNTKAELLLRTSIVFGSEEINQYDPNIVATGRANDIIFKPTWAPTASDVCHLSDHLGGRNVVYSPLCRVEFVPEFRRRARPAQ